VYNDDPTSGKGFEAAVAYAVAEKLGFSKDDVVWVRTSFEAAIAPGPKNFDFNIQQYTITDERKQAVDFSSPYFEASQTIVAIKGGKADGVTDLAGAKGLLLGAMAGSTSATTIEEAIAPTTPAALFSSNEDARAALEAGQLVVLLAAGRQDDDGGVDAAGAHLPQAGHAVHEGHHQIEDDQIVAAAGEQRQGGGAVPCLLAGVARIL
jgi:ABC-type amino acid transport substrate-binding protein